MSGLAKVVYNIVRGLTRFVSFLVITLLILLIKVITFEPGKDKKITVRKARRIRTLSKFKNFVINSLPQEVVNFLGWDSYKTYFNKHIRNGLQLC